MKSLRAGLLALIALGVTGALADGIGDRGRITEGTYTPPVPNWSGFYIGAALGYGTGASEFSESEVNLFDINLRGRQGVVAAGYDFQLSPRWVLGLLADYAFGEVEGDVVPLFAFAVTIDKQWAVGGRLGVLATPSTLLYASAGYTAADFKLDVGGQTADEEKLDGYFAGFGFEQAFGRNLSLKLDYRFSDYGNVAIADIENEVHSVRLGLNYRFGR